MLKELILAIILGALLGLGITGGYLALDKKNNSQNQNQPIITSPTPLPEESINDQNNTDKNQNDNLTIESVEDNDIVPNEKLEITGTTFPNSPVIATLKETVVDDKSDHDGKFNLQIKLESGLNIIKITVINPEDNNQIEKTLNITYSTAKI